MESLAKERCFYRIFLNTEKGSYIRKGEIRKSRTVGLSVKLCVFVCGETWKKVKANHFCTAEHVHIVNRSWIQLEEHVHIVSRSWIKLEGIFTFYYLLSYLDEHHLHRSILFCRLTLCMFLICQFSLCSKVFVQVFNCITMWGQKMIGWGRTPYRK